ncbi:MAG: 16S rRNA (uracil(1498)-N(3))-methyltransferase [Lachnospiraceae bacterium]|nr:16S rRNA (uracil(1498)-N(3))-methyltransferase [Lachnospiraceae bacterium]
MHRFYIDEQQHMGNEIRVTGEDVNHIKNVLRLKEGDRILLCNSVDTDHICEIADLSEKGTVLCTVLESKKSDSELPVRIVLYQGLPKKDKMELIIQKCVELGVTEIVPVTMKRCIVKIEDEKSEAKKNLRWNEISRAAAKQSGRGIIPKVGRVMNFKEALKKAASEDPEHLLVPYENENGILSLKKFASEMAASLKKGSKPTVSVFIGPEGGFDESEIEEAKTAGATTVSLGRRILRTETAGLTTAAILMYETETGNDSLS